MTAHLGTAIDGGSADFLVEVQTATHLILPGARVPSHFVVDNHTLNATGVAATAYGVVDVRFSAEW